MKIWFDTEFIEDGKTIDLLSIGLVRDDGLELYCESSEADISKACPWVQKNVLPHLVRDIALPKADIAEAILDFAGDDPQFWAWFAAYDWVVLCQLFGRMVDLPRHFPMRCNDVAQLAAGYLITCPKPELEHCAISDARWARDAWFEVVRMRAAA